MTVPLWPENEWVEDRPAQVGDRVVVDGFQDPEGTSARAHVVGEDGDYLGVRFDAQGASGEWWVARDKVFVIADQADAAA